MPQIIPIEAKMQMLEAKALETEAFVLARTDEILK